MGVPQQPERPYRLHDMTGWGSRKIKPPARRCSVAHLWEERNGSTAWYRQSKETKCGGKGDRVSEHFIVPITAGTLAPQGPGHREGNAESLNHCEETR